jgi:arylsulfatase
VYIHDGRLHYAYNMLGLETTIVAADEPLPPRPVRATIAFTPTGNHRGDVELRYDERTVGRGTIERMVPVTYGMTGFDVGRQRGAPVLTAFPGRFEMPAGALGEVVVEVDGPPSIDAAAQQQAGLAAQ